MQQGQLSDHNQPPNKRLKVMPPTTIGVGSGMAASEYQVP